MKRRHSSPPAGPHKRPRSASVIATPDEDPIVIPDAPVLYPEASLMGIPAELRLQILKQLLPTRKYIPSRTDNERIRNEDDIARHYCRVRNIRRHHRRANTNAYYYTVLPKEHSHLDCKVYEALRYDWESCTPAVLRVNRVMYEEGREIMYKYRTFEAHLKGRELSIASQKFDLDTEVDGEHNGSQLFDRLKYIESIHLKVSEISKNQLDEEKGKREIVESLHNLAFELDFQNKGARLVVEITVKDRFKSYDDKPALFTCEERVKWMLNPLDKIRGKSKVRLMCTAGSTLVDTAYGTDAKSMSRLELEHRAIHNWLTELARRMCSDAPLTVKPTLTLLYRYYCRFVKALHPLRAALSHPNLKTDLVSQDYKNVNKNMDLAWKASNDGDVATLKRMVEDLRKEQLQIIRAMGTCHTEINKIHDLVESLVAVGENEVEEWLTYAY